MLAEGIEVGGQDLFPTGTATPRGDVLRLLAQGQDESTQPRVRRA